MDELKDRLNRHQGHRVRNRLQRLRQPPLTPYSGRYESTVSGLGNELRQGQADLAGRGLALDQSYGIGDNSNPYSMARNLERDREATKLGTTTAAATRGQLFSGAYQNQQRLNREGFNQSQDEMMRRYLAEKAGLAREGQGLQSDYDTGVLDAYAGRLEDALSVPPDASEYPRRLRDRVNRGRARSGGSQGGRGRGRRR